MNSESTVCPIRCMEQKPSLQRSENPLRLGINYIGKSKRVKGIFSRLQWHLAEGWRIWFYCVWFSVPFLFGRYLHGFWWLWESTKRAAEHADPLTAFNGRTREDRDTRELQGIGSSYRLSHWRRERDRLASMVAPARPVGTLKYRDFFRWLN